MANYLQVEKLTKSYGNLLLFENISFGIEDGQRLGLIAKNGAGKSTLLNIIAGKEDYDSGSITCRNNLRIGYLNQEPRYPEEWTVFEACFNAGNEIAQLIATYEKALVSNHTDELDQLMTKMDLFKAWDYELRIKQILTQLQITDFAKKIGELSGGQLKRVALANVLIIEPELLLMDEPTNQLDLGLIEWLENYLKRMRISLLMVTHDRFFLDRICSEIIEIDNQQLYRYKGNYSYYLEKRQERIDAKQTENERDQNLFRKELEWMRRKPQARATKAKARIDSFQELEEKIKQKNQNNTLQLKIKASYTGNKIFEVKNVNKRFGDIIILDHFNYIFSRYEKMGIIGDNGTGKSTFIKLLIGESTPDNGTIDIGETVQFGYYSQDGLQFDEQMKVIDVVQNIAEVIDIGGGKKLTASQFLQHFLFPVEKQHDFVGKLSGGEKRRLYLCTVLIKNPNFLVLDEPTNDLDIITLNVLEEYLQNFKACVIIVSHDRFFMDKVVDHVLVFNGNGDIKEFPGNYTQYRNWKDNQVQVEKEKQLQNRIKNEKQTTQESPNVKKKLTYNERKEFENLDSEIQKLEIEKKNIEQTLSSGTLISDELINQSHRIADIIQAIDDKTTRWMELSERN